MQNGGERHEHCNGGGEGVKDGTGVGVEDCCRENRGAIGEDKYRGGSVGDVTGEDMGVGVRERDDGGEGVDKSLRRGERDAGGEGVGKSMGGV